MNPRRTIPRPAWRKAFGGWAAVLLAAATGGLVSQSAETVSAKGDAEKLSGPAMQLLHANCLSCHNAEKHKGGLMLHTRDLAMKGGDTGPAVAPDNVEASMLLKLIEADADPHMPPKKQLSAQQVALLRNWITAGAPWNEAVLAKASAPREVRPGPLPPGVQPVLALALSPDGSRLAAGRGNHLLLYDVAGTNQTLLAETTAHADMVRALAWSPDGSLLASGAFRELKAWNGANLAPVWEVRSNLADRVTALKFSAYGGALAAGDGMTPQSWLRLYEAGTGRALSAWKAHDDTIYDLSFSTDGGMLASAGGDKVVRLWEVISQREVGRIEAHMGAVSGAAFNTNSSEMVTIGADKQLKLWDTKARESVVTVAGRRRNLGALAWSADSRVVATVDDEGALFTFTDFKRHTGAQSSDTANERQLARWPTILHAVTLNADGKRIFVGGQDGMIAGVDENGKELKMFRPGTNTNAPALAKAAPSFVHDVLPLLAKSGCMAGACHAKPEGQNGFRLSVFSYDPKADYEEIVTEGRGRRNFPPFPEESLLLLKSTLAVEHGGGQRIEPGSETYRTVVEWIRGGMVYQHTNEAMLVSIDVEPKEKLYQKGETRPLKVTAHYSDRSTRDVTALADYISNEKELAAVDEQGVVKAGSLSGEGVVVARFMGFVDAARITVPSEKSARKVDYTALPANNFIDRLAYAQFEKLGLNPSETCTDAEFLRRSSLDAVGVLPTAEESKAFLDSQEPDKRRRWISHLLEHPGYADYWANKWADLLRPNSDRVGVKSIYVLDQWIRAAFRENMPYDKFARAILTAEGSNHRNGPAVVYRDRREPQELTTMFSQLFLGVRMECAKCHHHPNEKWSQDDFYQFAAFFGPVKQKGAGLSPPISAGTETFFFGPGGTVKNPVTDQVMKPRAPDGPELAAGEGDPRERFATWLTYPGNPFFAKAAVNRVWAVFFGRGFVNPVDDFRVSNPAANEPLLDALAQDFTKHHFDYKHLIRTILESRLYQLSSTPNDSNLTDTHNFSRSYRRRLAAEVLLDAVNDVTGVPDEFNGSPPGTRAMQTWSYKVPSHFMDAFGRPNSSSDCPCERDLRTSVVQSLHLMNSTTLQGKLANPEGRVRRLADGKLPPEELVTELYLTSLNRRPSGAELEKALAAFSAKDATRQTAAEDVMWALLNSPEFLFNH